MRFHFYKYHSRENYLRIIMTTSGGSLGEMELLASEWDALKSILIHGRTWFQRGEVEIVFSDKTSTPAFVEGGE